MKLGGRGYLFLVLAILAGALLVTDRLLPATSDYQSQVRVWLTARATGIVALGLLSVAVAVGIAISHPAQARLKQAKRLYPWHETLWVFVLAFVAVHVVSLVIDEYADVGVLGALVPGMSAYRPIPVAIGSLALYALLLTGLTARFTRLLPSGAWLQLHRLGTIVLVLGWLHGVLAGTDSPAVALVYLAIAAPVVGVAMSRYWMHRPRRQRSTPVRTEESHAQPQPTP